VARPAQFLSTPSFTIDLGPEQGADPALRGLARLILHSDAKLTGWTGANLRRRLKKLLPERACILILRVRGGSSDHLHLDVNGRDRPAVAELFDLVGRKRKPPAFLFLAVDDEIDPVPVAKSLGSQTDAAFICCARSTQAAALVSLGCEFSRWWGLSSLFQESVALLYLAERLTVFVEALNGLLPTGEDIAFANSMQVGSTAWTGGSRLVTSVDYEKILAGARDEQVADTIKRLADAGLAPRTMSQPLAEHLVSSQALFWFTELDQGVVDFDWLRGTRFAFDLFGPDHPDSPTRHRLPSRHPSPVALKALREQFVSVPGGLYKIGTEVASDRSEPPAPAQTVTVNPFQILERPVVLGDWELFCEIPAPASGPPDLPVTGCTAFDAFSFAALVENVFRSAGLIAPGEGLSLPTEREWEVAARGSDGLEYPWGDIFDPARCNCGMGSSGPTVVGAYSPIGNSPFGCQDMAGNVREWTRTYGGVPGVDWNETAIRESLRDLKTLRPTDRLVVRGGSYSYDDFCVRTWMRNTQLAERQDSQTGFRLVIDSMR
jgi:formylglycine-generating enzyme required for sulfatase activity